MESGLRARASEARAIRARWRVGKSKRRVTSKNSLFHHHHPNFYDFFLRAIAPFTGKHCVYKKKKVFTLRKKDRKIEQERQKRSIFKQRNKIASLVGIEYQRPLINSLTLVIAERRRR